MRASVRGVEYAARVAPEIDRLVLAVNRRASVASRQSASEMAASVGLPTLASLPHYAEFLLAGQMSESVLLTRLPYLPADELQARFETWRQLDLVTGPADRMVAAPDLVAVLETILDARAQVAADLWSDAASFGPASELVERVLDLIPDRFELAAAHLRLPAPPDPYLRLHRRLTTIRYARSQAHVGAWRAERLDAGQASSMTLMLSGGRPEASAGLDELEARGLAEQGELTLAGRKLRARIEEATNRSMQPVFAFDDHDRQRLLSAVARLPGDIS